MPKSPAEIRITTGTIVNGVYFNAGEVLPFERIEDLPESLKGLVSDGSESFYSPSQRNIYGGQPGPEPGFVFQGVSNTQWVQRQASQVAGVAQEQDWAAEHANEPLPKETLEVLEDEHTHRIEKLKAQAGYNQKITDAAYESLAQAAEPPALFVKRGGEMGRVERSKLKPGEAVYAKFDEGDWQVVGYVDATGQAPPPPLIP